MSNNTPDYKDNLVFEPDYSIYETAKRIKRLAYERDIKFERSAKVYLDFDNFCIDIPTRRFFSINKDQFIVEAKSNKHLVDIVEVLTRS